KSVAFKSLGQLRYLSAIKHVDLVLGNSSSGIVEVPFFNTPTVNIGDRQKGRIVSKSVINCPVDEQAISTAIEKDFDSDFKEEIQYQQQVHGDGNTSDKIIDVILNRQIRDLKKPFYDIKFK